MKKLKEFHSKDLETLRIVRQQIEDIELADENKQAALAQNRPNQLQNWYDVDEDNNPPASSGAIVGFIVHCVTKGMVVVLFLFRGLFSTLFNGLILNEMMVVFAVLDFWVTKNFTGKRLLGIRWYFDVDEYGTQKFFYECRANDKYRNFTFAKLFWVVLLVYSLAPFLFMVLGFIHALFVIINLELIIVSVGILIAGGLNAFFFLQANSDAVNKQMEIKRKLTPEQLQDIRYATIYSYT